jgi:hypothetical protein
MAGAVLEPVIARYRESVKRLYFRGDAAFANPEIYEFLETERIGYTIRLPANTVLQNRIAYLLKRPVGRPPHEVRRHYASFTYRAQSWNKPRRVPANVEWHPVAHEPGSVDPPKITLVSLAAVAEWAQPFQRTAPSWRTKVPCSGRRRFTDGVLAHVRTPGGPTGLAQPLLRFARSPSTSYRLYTSLSICCSAPMTHPSRAPIEATSRLPEPVCSPMELVPGSLEIIGKTPGAPGPAAVTQAGRGVARLCHRL